MSRTILITGATGHQGGATIRELAGQGFSLRAMTRKPSSEAARALAAAGVEVVRGDLIDAASVSAAVAGAWAVYAVQNTWEAGVEQEEVQGKRMAELARRAGVEHFVYASVGSANRHTGIPHFDNKSRVEDTVRSLGFPSTVILRPVFFMENLLSPWFLNGDTLNAALRPDTRLQMIAVEDIGRYGARAFTQAADLNGREIDLAGDTVTMAEAAAVLSQAFGRTIRFQQIPIEDVRKNSEDLAVMLEWFERVGYNADIPGLEREFGFKPLSLAAWAAAVAPQP
jgi:uncharacterized protein YbjT (DUF2867 family)